MAADEGLHEIQLNGKQLVFLFMASTVVAVVIFLCGVMVGRGVRAQRPALEAAVEAAPLGGVVTNEGYPLPANRVAIVSASRRSLTAATWTTNPFPAGSAEAVGSFFAAVGLGRAAGALFNLSSTGSCPSRRLG